MFELKAEEYESLRSQIGTLKRGQHSKYLPIAFTEQGIAMLSSVLNSSTAVEMNIQIIRVFIKTRELILTNKDILIQLEQLEKNMIKRDYKIKKHQGDIKKIFSILNELLDPPQQPRTRIGFRRKDEDV